MMIIDNKTVIVTTSISIRIKNMYNIVVSKNKIVHSITRHDGYNKCVVRSLIVIINR